MRNLVVKVRNGKTELNRKAEEINATHSEGLTGTLI